MGGIYRGSLIRLLINHSGNTFHQTETQDLETGKFKVPSNEKIEFENCSLVLSNGFPLSFESSRLIGMDGIREFEQYITERLGHPVVCLKLYPAGDGGCTGDIFHPDTVLIKENAYQDSAYPVSDSQALGLWNGENIDDMYELLAGTSLIGIYQRVSRYMHTAVFSLRSQRLSQNECHKLTIGLERSRRYTYFRDQAGRSLLIFSGVAVKCPDTSRLVTAMKRMEECHFSRSFVDWHSDELREMGCEVITEAYREIV